MKKKANFQAEKSTNTKRGSLKSLKIQKKEKQRENLQFTHIKRG